MENVSEQVAEVLLGVLLDASTGESYPDIEPFRHWHNPGVGAPEQIAAWADVLDILIPALESHRDCARRGL